MDEGTLNDLLECSVCLERLDTSSKVLPCQHTFCKKCLEEIVQKHKELRCPECRVLVTVKVDELPPNVLLMRILEGIRNAGPKKIQRCNRSPLQQTPVSLHHNVYQQSTPEHRLNNKHSTQLVSHQPYAKALYDYTSKEAGDLSFNRGDIIILRKRIDSHWYQGECGGKQGVFPISYVHIITPQPSLMPQCKALYDFRMTNDEEEGCLVFNKGDIINVIRRVDENWAEGKLDGRIGIFPLAFVELNSPARSLMKLSSNAQPGPSRTAPPTPTANDGAPLIPTDHSRTVRRASPRLPPAGAAEPASSNVSSSGSSTTPNASSSSTSSSSSTAPSSPASPPANRGQQQPPLQRAPKPDVVANSTKCGTPQRSPRSSESRHNKEKRHSFTSLTPPQHSSGPHRHSAEISGSEAQAASGINVERARKSGHSTGHPPAPVDSQLPAAYIALYSYKPQKPDELELRKGGIYMVTERCQDGWYKGTSNRTQKCGVFPGNYVTVARGAPKPSPAPYPESMGAGDAKFPVTFTRGGKPAGGASRAPSGDPPELPPRAPSPAAVALAWQEQQQQQARPRGPSAQQAAKAADKSRDRKEKGTVSLMRRLASMKRSKSPPPSSYSMDNPVFEDVTISTPKTSSPGHPVHVRSGSCPSQLLQAHSTGSGEAQAQHHRMFGSASQRSKHKERPSVIAHGNAARSAENPAGSSGSSPDVHRHRKSSSLDAGNKKTGVQTVRERFRCIAPYPPNSEYELELQVNDIIYVHKKREDGWYKGTQQRTGKTGLFPASFVDSY